MRKVAFTLLLLILWTDVAPGEGVKGLIESQKGERGAAAVLEAVTCPKDEAEWISWRDAAAERLLEPTVTRNAEAFISLRRIVPVADELDLFISACAQNQLPPSILNLAAFSRTLGVNNYKNHRFGFSIDDMTYINSVRQQIDLPPLLKSQQFLKSLRKPATYTEAKRLIDEHNKTLPPDKQWVVLLYKSRFLTTPDQAQTFGRFFIYVPDGRYEKWIQFGIVTPGDPVRDVNNVSIVSLDAPDGEGRRRSAIIDHWRTYEADGSVSLGTRYETVGETENCAICHKTSPLAIRPAEEYVLSEQGALVLNTTNPGIVPEQLNAKIEDYGSPYFGDWLDVNDFGPSIGPRARTRGIEFIRACSLPVPLTEESLERVKNSMRCDSCHNDGFVGPINVPPALKTDADIGQLETYITEGWMPPNKNLSASEKQALFNCLRQDYHDLQAKSGVLMDWLLQR
ncbi:hypothetical protein GHK50_32670 [Sinorhizobium medicae]|uniref:Cytochrome c domain-containing protein n=1 Tax=Sinorhizobium medicae TaxID=110321 RepID=A0A6G1WUL3_9HYPH|nr:hypothetical protein [Sinorhizobium medicae]MDX0587080.1 hypothetical protein [Sinorhizobium medicae]MQV96811.1 hypothetical protein [Sinorhizobium medicae]MQW73337.1 hypothetical protein [Sinorhizobium medicae]MQX87616.1 hypothetical protein [Sinorhizobium medicae]MQX98701.1 hypothetical protein [Sinorhizobium medicae]